MRCIFRIVRTSIRFKTFFLSLIIVTSATAQGSVFSKMVTFGDSLSDTGNIAIATVDFPYPYYENRISNGPVLVDYLALHLDLSSEASGHLVEQQLGFNYAVGGANIIGNSREDLDAQLTAYLSRSNDNPDPDALYFILIGGNDVRALRSLALESDAVREIEIILQTLESQLARLMSAGARRFIVSNVANIARLPETIERSVDDPNIINRAQRYTVLYNQSLKAMLRRLESVYGAQIMEFDLYKQLEEVVASASTYGISETQVGCFDIRSLRFESRCVFGTRFDRYLFFDSVHPTAKTNQLAGRGLVRSADQLIELIASERKAVIAPIIELLLNND